jgi:membrane fusion protein, multidrug efflux system
LLIAGGLYNWLTTRNIESTDDAYTDSRAITIAPQVSGVVLSLAINDNQFVKKDQLLIHIDPRQYVNDRDQARACWRRRRRSMRGSSSAPKSRAGRGRAFSKTCRSFWMTGIQNAIH